MKDIGSNIRKIRQQKNMTLEEVANRIGKTKSYLSKLERGEKRFNLENLQLVAKALGVDEVELFPNKQKVHNPITNEDDWAFVISTLKEKGYTAADIYLKIAQEEIEKDKKNQK